MFGQTSDTFLDMLGYVQLVPERASSFNERHSDYPHAVLHATQHTPNICAPTTASTSSPYPAALVYNKLAGSAGGTQLYIQMTCFTWPGHQRVGVVSQHPALAGFLLLHHAGSPDVNRDDEMKGGQQGDKSTVRWNDIWATFEEGKVPLVNFNAALIRVACACEWNPSFHPATSTRRTRNFHPVGHGHTWQPPSALINGIRSVGTGWNFKFHKNYVTSAICKLILLV